MYNVIPKFHGLTVPQIKESIKRYPFSVASYNVAYGINIGSILRACNVFAATNFIHIGHRKWDRRGSLGVQNYENIVYHETWEESLKWMREQNYTPIGVDKVEGLSIDISSIGAFEGHPVFIMGAERGGIPPSILKECSSIIHIAQYGSIPSLNVAQAAAIICNKYHELRIKNGK